MVLANILLVMLLRIAHIHEREPDVLKSLVDSMHARILLLCDAVVLVLSLFMRTWERYNDDAVQHRVFFAMVPFWR